MKTDPWMPLWIGDYLRDTMHLTTIQHGGYLMVLMSLWTSPSGKLPFDEKTLCRITRMTPQEWEENHLVITQFLTVEDGMFYQQRLLHERLKSEEIRKKRAESGRLGGRPKKAFGLEPEKNQTVKQNESKTKVSHNHNHSTGTTVGAQTELALAGRHPEHQAFIKGWRENFKEFFHADYSVDGGKDGRAVKEVLTLGITRIDLLEMAKAAWKRQTFSCKQAQTIHGFRHHINQIKAELYGPHLATDTKGNDRNRGTFNEGKASQYANAYVAPKPLSDP